MKINLTAVCLFGLEHLLCEEIKALGYDLVDTMDGRVTFAGDEEAVAFANVFLRYAERVYIEMGTFPATTFDELFEGTKALPWEIFVGKLDAFPVKGHSVRSQLASVPACQKMIKKAIATRLGGVYGTQRMAETGAICQVVFFLFKDKAQLLLDTSGAPLYKRGYRTETGEAPLRETLAAAIAALSRPRENVLLWDPMCGSGTIAIEAAMQMKNIAPGKNRHFAAEYMQAIPKSVWMLAREQAADEEVSTTFEAYASDIDASAVALAIANARRAGVAENVKCFTADARHILNSEGRRGTIVTNPPYGERLGTIEEAEALYRQIGKTFQALSPWQVYVITSHQSFEKFYGKRADKIRKLYNGMLPCYFYQYFRNDTKK